MREGSPLLWSERKLIEVREMRLGDIEEVAKVHLDAFAGYMNVAMGEQYVRAFLSWFCKAPDGLAFIARINGKMAGYVVGAPAGYGERLTKDLLWVVAASLARRPWLILRADIRRVLVSRLAGLRPEPVEGPGPVGAGEVSAGVVSLVGIGVAADARGKGVGGELIKVFESASRELGMAAMRLSVYRENVSARHLYERAGWQPIEEDAVGEGTEMCYMKRIDDDE